VSSRLSHSLASTPRRRGLREYYRRWLTLRRTHPALGARGKELTRVTRDESGVLTVIRASADGNEVRLVANLAPKTQTLPALGPPAWRIVLDSDAESFGGTGAAAPLAPYQCLLFEAQR
jgi:glycosidase